MTKRTMTVGYAPGKERLCPMIRISNKLITTAGFEIGTAIEVLYQQGAITINKIDQTK